MIKLNTDIRYLRGIGEKRAELFNKLGVFNVGELLRYLPRAYEDRTDIRDICNAPEVYVPRWRAEYALSEREQVHAWFRQGCLTERE